MEKIRVTFYGKEINYKDLSHQHLSNIIWYNQITDGSISFTPTKNAIKESIDEHNEIKERFGGIVLPYKPLVSFPAEIDQLERHEYLKPIVGTLDSDIIVDGKWIGKVIYN